MKILIDYQQLIHSWQKNINSLSLYVEEKISLKFHGSKKYDCSNFFDNQVKHLSINFFLHDGIQFGPLVH